MSHSTSKATLTAGRSTSTKGTTPSKKNVGVGELKDGQRSRDGRFRWSAGWAKWVPAGKGTLEVSNPDLSENQILGIAALLPIRHGPSCLCGTCSVAGQRYADYAKAKGIWP